MSLDQLALDYILTALKMRRAHVPAEGADELANLREQNNVLHTALCLAAGDVIAGTQRRNAA